jgi:D-glycerate 3-kinase
MIELEIINILSTFIKNNQLSSSQLKLLRDNEVNHQYPLKFANNYQFLQQKLDILANIYPQLNLLFQDLKLTNESSNINNTWYFWLPLALELAEKKKTTKSSFYCWYFRRTRHRKNYFNKNITSYLAMG